MTGLAGVMGTDRTPHETFIQNAGKGSRITVSNLRHALEKSRSLQTACLLYAHAFAVQTTYTAIANGRSKIEKRLARWLLGARGSCELANKVIETARTCALGACATTFEAHSAFGELGFLGSGRQSSSLDPWFPVSHISAQAASAVGALSEVKPT